jgi:catechol 2,3-dioxygenase-like lactoylglutathione lyase family enzyme
MLSSSKLYTVLSTTDLEKSKKFYTDIVGLTESKEDGPEGIVRLSAGEGTGLVLYQRSDSPKAENTVAGFMVDDIEAEVADLQTKGVTFEEYDYPEIHTENGIATLGNTKSAWFKDPDGNIIAINSLEK